jgi:hypothetical protein
MKKLYLAGPMRGHPEDNYPHFNEIAAKLREQGYAVFNPAENNVIGGSFNDFMAIDLPEVCRADGVAVLTGWEKSQGAQLEVLVARRLGKHVIDAYTLQGVPDGLKPTNPKDVAAIGKLDFSLVPAPAIAYLSLALTEGDYKYGGYNYRIGGVLASVYLAALDRHKFKYQSGEWEDSKTLVPHLASMMACCAILIDAHELGVLNDDRPPAFDMAELIDRLSKITTHLKTIWPDGPGRFTEVNRKEKVE